MKDLENGYVYADDAGYAHFVSYDTLGSGSAMIFFMVAATIFIKSINTYLLDNKWIAVIPTIITVALGTLISDKDIPLYKRIINIIFDFIKCLCMYRLLLIIIDKAANAHWLDRFFFVVFFGAIFFVADWLTKFALKFLRTPKLYILHALLCIVISVIAMNIYFNHTWYWQGYDYTVRFNKATIVKLDERMEGSVVMPSEIYGYTVENIGERAFYYNEKITLVELPDTVKVIKKNAFGFSPPFKVLKIPKSVKKIEASWGAEYNFEIYYEGSAEDWDKIDIQDNALKNVKVKFNCS